MTWRVAVAGADDPGLRRGRAAGGRAVDDGTFAGSIPATGRWACSSPRSWSSARSASSALTRDAPGHRRPRASRRCAPSCGSPPANAPFRVLVACFVVQAAGVARHARRRAVLRRPRAARPRRGHVAVRLRRRPGPAGDAAVEPGRRAASASSGATSRRRCSSPSARSPWCASPLLPAWAVYADRRRDRLRVRRPAGLRRWPCCRTASPTTPIRTGNRQAGVFTGLWTAGETFGLALGPGIYALTLQLFGYVLESAPATRRPSTTPRELGVLLGFTVVPGIVVGLALLFLRAYDLPPTDCAGWPGRASAPRAAAVSGRLAPCPAPARDERRTLLRQICGAGQDRCDGAGGAPPGLRLGVRQLDLRAGTMLNQYEP